MSLNNKTAFAASTDNKTLVKVVSTKDNTGTTVMILNQELTTSYNYTIRLDNTPIATASALKINIDKGQATEYTSTLTIPAQATQVVVFDNAGNVQKIIEYSLTDAQNQTAPRVVYTGSVVTDIKTPENLQYITQDGSELKFALSKLNAQSDFRLSIYTIAGRLVYSKRIQQSCQNISIDKRILGKGIFITNLITDKMNHVDKLVVVK